ncbi:MAG: hypothetical protein JXR37_23435 [Kiritimatiellae bacterium]|nr:hypothetical protein [Kiritimatiellia bacterium]
MPFTLRETEAFLAGRGVGLVRKDLVELYMCLGGIPHYLRQVRKGLSVPQVVDELCFHRSGILHQEYARLFASLFEHPDLHIRIVHALARTRQGVTRRNLLRGVRVASGGGVSRALVELEEAGFVSKTPQVGKRARDALYRLSDEYVRFYLTWIADAPESATGYWLQKRTSRASEVWAGFSFESLCLKHVQELKEALGIGAVSTIVSGWHWTPEDSADRGTQIDLVIDRADNCVDLCEMKFASAPFSIDKKLAGQLRAKREVFVQKTGTRKNVFLVLVTTHAIRPNRYSEMLLDKFLTSAPSSETGPQEHREGCTRRSVV